MDSCCGVERSRHARAPARRRGIGRMVLSGAILALMPKCPFCLMAWAAWAGVGLSLPLATSARWAILIACGATLVFTAWRWAVRPRIARSLD